MNTLDKKRWIFVLALLFVAVCEAKPTGDRMRITNYSVESPRPHLNNNAYTFSTTNRDIAVVRTVTEFVNDLLQFRYIDGYYIANYQLIVDLFDPAGTRVDGIIEKDHIVVADFDATNSRKLVSRYQVDFNLSPGTYYLYVEITDETTKRIYRQQRDVSVSDFSDSLAISDIAILQDIEFDSGMIPTMLSLTRNYDNPKADFVAYLEIYSGLQDSVRMDYRIYDQAGYKLITFSEFVWPEEGVIRKLVPLKELIAFPGRYLVVVEGRVAGMKVSRRESFRIQYWEPPSSLAEHGDFSNEVLALKHVAKSKEFAKIVGAEREQRNSLVEGFWAQRDPTPGTQRNELRQEFLKRVMYTLRNYSNVALNQHGPDTDRGKVYIVCGPPTEITRNTLPTGNRVYEVWYYKKADRRYIFVDKSGFGNYKLIRKD